MNATVLSKRRKTVKQANVDVIRCGLGDDVYCLEMSAVAGVTPSRDLLPAAGDAPAGSAGCGVPSRTKRAGVRSRRIAELPPDSPDKRHYTVLIDHPRRMYGLRVESVSRVIRADRRQPLAFAQNARTHRRVLSRDRGFHPRSAGAAGRGRRPASARRQRPRADSRSTAAARSTKCTCS